MSESQIRMTGRVVARLYDKDGNLLLKREGDNLVMHLAKINAALQWGGAGGTVVSHMAMGDSAANVDDEQTALQGTEVERVAVEAPVFNENKVTHVATLGAGLGGEVIINEFGLFDQGSGGNMMARWLSQEFTMGPTDSLSVEWTLTFG